MRTLTRSDLKIPFCALPTLAIAVSWAVRPWWRTTTENRRNRRSCRTPLGFKKTLCQFLWFLLLSSVDWFRLGFMGNKSKEAGHRRTKMIPIWTQNGQILRSECPSRRMPPDHRLVFLPALQIYSSYRAMGHGLNPLKSEYRTNESENERKINIAMGRVPSM